MCRKGDLFAMSRQPEDVFDYEKQLIYGADYKDHLHEINALGYVAYTKLRKEREARNNEND